MAKRKLNTNQALIITATILGLAIASYGYFNYRAKMAILVQERESIIENEKKRDFCISEVIKESYDSWNKTCEKKGLEKDCQLPRHSWERSDEKQKIGKENCIKMYPAN